MTQKKVRVQIFNHGLPSNSEKTTEAATEMIMTLSEMRSSELGRRRTASNNVVLGHNRRRGRPSRLCRRWKWRKVSWGMSRSARSARRSSRSVGKWESCRVNISITPIASSLGWDSTKLVPFVVMRLMNQEILSMLLLRMIIMGALRNLWAIHCAGGGIRFFLSGHFVLLSIIGRKGAWTFRV